MEIVTNVGVKNIINCGGCSVVNGSKKKIEPFQKSAKIPYPINKSLNKNPANIEPTARIINGTNITIGDS